MRYVLKLTTILWLCAAYAAQGQGDVKTGDAVPIKTTDRLKGVVLCFAPSQLCGGCSQDLDAIAYECQQRGVPLRVYLQDPGFGNGMYSLAEERPMVTIHDDELRVYAGLYHVARSPFAMVVSSNGIVQSTGIPGAKGFDIDPFLKAIRNTATAGSGDVFFGPRENRARYARTLCPIDGDTLVERALTRASIAYFPERNNTLIITRDESKRLLVVDSNGKVISENPAMPSNFQYSAVYPRYFAQSASGDSVLVDAWSADEDRTYLYWLRLHDGRADSIRVPEILNRLRDQEKLYHHPSKTSFHTLRFDDPPTGRKLEDRSLILGLGPTGFRLFGLRPQVYDTDSILPVESGTAFAVHGDQLWVISRFRDSLTRYDLRTWDSVSVPIGLSSTYYVDPLPVLTGHFRDPMSRQNTQTRMSYSVGILSAPNERHIAVMYVVPISKLTGKETTSSSFDYIFVVVLVDAVTGRKVREIEFPQAVIPWGFRNGQFLCAAYYGSSIKVKWYDMPAE
ncbi:MAG: hypothetical protein FGM32_10695 [Candidatus Kapabacteria bacterium]|nr:hypothetical protein [Candidatus Kapabacteria bacterium]